MHFGSDLEVILEGFWNRFQVNLEACVRCSEPMKVLALPANLSSWPVLDEPETSQNRYQISIEKYIQKICAYFVCLLWTVVESIWKNVSQTDGLHV